MLLRKSQLLLVSLVGLLLTPFGCSPSGGDGIRSETVTLRPEGNRLVIGPDSLLHPELSEFVLVVPPGAVTQPTEITIIEVPSLAGADQAAAGPALRISPVGLQLAQPISVELPYDSRAFSFEDKLYASVAGQLVALDNPLKRVIKAPKRPFVTSIGELGDIQALVIHPPGFMHVNMDTQVKKLDVLFVVDNSDSMSDKQMTMLKFASDLTATDNFMSQILGCTGIDTVHIGVINSDVGLSSPAKTTWPGSGDTTCDSAKGWDGNLIGSTCVARRTGGDCAKACPMEVAPNLANYIEFKNAGGVFTSSNLTVSSPDGVRQAFGCLAYQGEKGCGIEQPFEAIKRALAQSGNQAFFQYDSTKPYESLLVIVLLTDEDDCSIDQLAWSNPVGTKDGSTSTIPTWDNFGHDFRCLAMSTKCTGNWWASDGTKSNCVEDPAQTYLQDVAKLDTALNNRYGGRVLLASIGPLNPLKSATDLQASGYGTTAMPPPFKLQYDPRAPGRNESQLLQLKRNRCTGLTDSPDATAGVQHRLSKFAETAALTPGLLASYQGDICDEKDYGLVSQMLKQALSTNKQCN